MIEQLKRWCIEVSKGICNETVSTAGTICDETKKANANFVKAIMDSI